MKMITMFRPVGANELQLIIDSGMKRFPARLFWQPIFYPVLNFQYAAEIAERGNMGDGDSEGAGFVTAFEIPQSYFEKFQVQTVGLDHHQEFWVPAEKLEEFNDSIVNGIRVEASFLGKKFQLSDSLTRIIQNC